MNKIEGRKIVYSNKQLFKFKIESYVENFNKNVKIFRYHHILFCLSIVFFLTSKIMAAKFISFGSFTINVGGIVFSLVYLVADVMTEPYGIERTNQMIYFMLFINCMFAAIIQFSIYFGTNSSKGYKIILNRQIKMYIASAISFIVGATLNSSIIFLLKSNQKKRKTISFKKELLLTIWLRISTSTVCGIILDVSLFSIIAF